MNRAARWAAMFTAYDHSVVSKTPVGRHGRAGGFPLSRSTPVLTTSIAPHRAQQGPTTCAAIGARVTVINSSMPQIDGIHGGGSYTSANDTRPRSGLGRDAAMSKVKVQWSSGLEEELSNIVGHKICEIVEGQATKQTQALPLPGH